MLLLLYVFAGPGGGRGAGGYCLVNDSTISQAVQQLWY